MTPGSPTFIDLCSNFSFHYVAAVFMAPVSCLVLLIVIFIGHKYTINKKNLPNPLKQTNLYGRINTATELVIVFVCYILVLNFCVVWKRNSRNLCDKIWLACYMLRMKNYFYVYEFFLFCEICKFVIENLFNPIQNKGWNDIKINERGRNFLVGFLFNTKLVLNVITWIKKICLFEQVMDF